MSENNWIIEAKKHFEDNGGKSYISGDEISEKSKEINEKLQLILKEKFNNDADVELNLQGSKWSVQGQNRLTDGIWYRAYYKKFGKDYPIVFGVFIGKNGLNFAIQIYNNAIGDLSLSETLGQIIKEILKDKYLESEKRNNENEKYEDFGYFKLDFFDENKFKQVLSIYKEIIYQINSTIFDKMIELYKDVKLSSKHCLISENNENYNLRKSLKNKVDNFIEENTIPNDILFRSFWNRQIINSAQQASNATNIINRNGLQNLPEKIKTLVNLQYDNPIDLVENIQNQIEGSKKSSLELYYYYHMDNDNFPLINGGIENSISIIEKNGIKLNGNNIVEKMKELKNKMRDDNLKKFYLLDQFLNLIDKIKYEDISNEKDINNKRLYQLAYLFTFFRKSKLVSNSNFFDELLKKSKNIILYGAPGTGKTYTSEINISRLIEEEYPNEKIKIYDRFQKVQFHPSYSYEDFMEGLKPIIEDNNVILKLQKGDFMKFCEKASIHENDFLQSNEDEKLKFAFFFLVDEINRAELSRVFGEIMYALDKRGNKIQTQYSYMKDDDSKYFSIPNNVYFIGTMNDVDRSIDSFDIALRRRFFWYRMECDYFAIQSELSGFQNIGKFSDKDIPESGYLKACYELNQFITEKGDNKLGLGKLYQLGHDYFMKIKHHSKKKNIENNDLKDLFEFSIEPLLIEYLRSEYNEDEIEKHIETLKNSFKIESK